MDKNNNVKPIETNEFIASLRADGIVHVYIKPHTHITVETQQRMLNAYAKITTTSRPFIFEPGEFTSISKEARLNASNIEDLSPASRSVIVVQNLGQRILADYYHRFNAPKKPLKVVKDLASGIEWLLSQETDAA